MRISDWSSDVCSSDLLSDMGADVVRIDRSIEDDYPNPVINRGRSAILLDLKTEQGRATALAAMDHADVVLEGYRPGVMERLGLGTDIELGRNPRPGARMSRG